MIFRIPLIIFFLISNIINLSAQNNYIDATNYLPKNYVKNASIDYTEYLQKAINEDKDVIFPNFPILINEKGLKLSSNSNYKFQKKSILILKANTNSHYNILDLNGKKNIKIFNPVIYGDLLEHKSTKGEWGFGISIRGSENIYIENPIVKNCFGDGIYIGKLDIIHSCNIKITGAVIDNCGRNGLSITSAKNVIIKNSNFKNSKFKNPASGIDIEPNNADDILENILLNNIYTSGNRNYGIIINLANFRKNNKVDKNVSIELDGFVDELSDYGLSVWLNRENTYFKNIGGEINISNIKLYNNKKEPLRYLGTNKNKIKLNIKNISVSKSNLNLLNSAVLNYKSDKLVTIKNIKLSE